MIMSFKVFVFAATAYGILKVVEFVNKAMMSDSEKTRIVLLSSDYILKRHKGLVVLVLMQLLCQAIAFCSLAVAAFMWVVGV